MHSELLAKHGLVNYVAGADYNFRYQKAGKQVVDDLEKVLDRLNIRPKEIYTGQQVHGARVAFVDEEEGEDFVFGKTFKETDGLMTGEEETALLIKYADCTPIVLFDPVNRVHASVHSGWRGTVQRISVAAIEKMEREFGSKRDDLLVYLGPSIREKRTGDGSDVVLRSVLRIAVLHENRQHVCLYGLQRAGVYRIRHVQRRHLGKHHGRHR